MFVISYSVFHGKHLQPGLMFASKDRSIIKGSTFQVLHLRLSSLALPTYIEPDWKGLPGTNTLAYYEHSLCTSSDFKKY